MQDMQPKIPIFCSLSFNIKCAKMELKGQEKLHRAHFQEPSWGHGNQSTIHTYLTIILSAPRGVTRTAGAKT